MTAEPNAPPDPLRLPDPALLFEGRADRLRRLADGHATGDWLLLLARIAAGQRLAVREVPVQAPRAPGEGPPLEAARVPRDGVWRRMLGVILEAARDPGAPRETQDALRSLADSGASRLEEIADRVLAGEIPADELACAPFVAAALQAWFTALAARLDPAAVAAGTSDDACPVCGSPPVAAIVQQSDRRRYLSCALCSAEWNVPRLRCTRCGDEGAIAYLHAEGDAGTSAEACGACRAYLKLFDEEKRPGSEAAADDAATLALDLVLGEEGWSRTGTNLLLPSAHAR